MREAAAVARSRYPHIIQVHDFGLAEGLYYMVMELIDGPTLKAELKERRQRSNPFTFSQVAQLFTALIVVLSPCSSSLRLK